MSVGLYSGVSGLALGVGLYKNVSGLWGGSSGLINGFGGSGPFPGASLYLDFLTPPLDPRITFSRGSNATLVDATGKIVYAPANLLLQSQTFDNAAWTKSAGSITATTVLAPDGTNTADTFTATGDGFVTQGVSASASTAYIGSVWLRVSTGTRSVSLFRNDNGTGFSTTSVTVTTTWQRFTLRATSSATATIVSFQVGGGGSLPNGTTIELWGAQLEPVTYQTTPSTYVATTASAYYGPRFDYDPVTLAPKGLLIEEARTNRILQSEDFTVGAVWGATVTGTSTRTNSNTTLGFMRGLITATSANGGIRQVQTGLTSGQVYALSFYIQSTATNIQLFMENSTTTFGAPHTAQLNPSNGTAGTLVGFTSVTISAFGGGYIYTLITAPAGGTLIANLEWRITTSGDSMLLGRPQFEAGAFATSYIPTVASQVTRTADQCSIVAPNFAPWYNQSSGTLLVEYDYGTAASDLGVNNRYAVIVSDGSSNNRNAVYNQSGFAASGLTTSGGSTQAAPGAGTTIAANTPLKVAYAYAVNDFAISLNGGAAVTDTSGAVPTNLNQMLVGSALTNAAFLNGHIRQIAYYNTRLPNAQLQSLTA